MHISLDIRCSNCGNFAQRHLCDEETSCQTCPDQLIARTECPHCDYLLIMCWKNGQVLEAYAPGTVVNTTLFLNSTTYTLVPRRSRSPHLDGNVGVTSVGLVP